jgi:hypothetical protein
MARVFAMCPEDWIHTDNVLTEDVGGETRGQAHSALCRIRVVMDVVLFGPRPSLRRLSGNFRLFVR